MHSVTCSSDKAAAGICGPNLSLTNTSKFTHTWKLYMFLITDQQLWTTHFPFPSQTSLQKGLAVITQKLSRKKEKKTWQWNIMHRTILKSFHWVQPTRCDVSQIIYFCKMLYVLQTVFPSVIRSSKLHIQRQVFVRPIPDAVCAVLSSWLWMEKPSETRT